MGYTKETYNKGKFTVDADDLQSVTTLCIDSLKRHGGKTATYGINEVGRFIDDVVAYFEMLRDANEDIEDSKQLFPSVEGLCLRLGISRQTLSKYSTRNDAWKSAIEQTRNAIATCKVQLASHGRIPPLIFVFDMTNNYQYFNTSEYRITAEPIRDTETPSISTQQIDEALATDYVEVPQLPLDHERD